VDQESGRSDNPHNYLGDCGRRPGAEAKQAGERSAASLRGAALLQRGHHDDIVMTFTPVLSRIVKTDRIPNTEYIRFLRNDRIPNTEYIRFLKMIEYRIPNSTIRTLLFE